MEEAVAALENAGRFAAEVQADLSSWRWTILSAHNALQGFMVVAIRDSAGINVLPKALAKAWLKAHEDGQSYPEERLDSFLNLYGKIKKTAIAAQFQAVRFVPSGTQSASVRRLNTLRNTFIHFLPASWSLEVSGLPRICLDSVGVIEFLAFSYRTISWSDDKLPARVSQAAAAIRRTLVKLGADYRAAA
jgi:hypothetical protein